MKIKTILKIFAFLTGFAFGWAVCSDAYTIRQIRSLAAANSVQNGASFGSPPAGVLPFSPPGGGLQWTVLVTGTAPSLSWQVQGQMQDGTWVPVVPAFQAPQSSPTFVWTGVIPGTTQAFTFFGPFQDMRVVITAFTSGTLTADIYVEY